MRTFEPTCDRRTIPYPETETEFEIQAFIYSELRAMGVDVRGELVTTFYDGSEIGCRSQKCRTVCRFDLVVFADRKPVHIIEVKRERKKVIKECGRQCGRYRRYGVPVTFVSGMDQSRTIVSQFYASRPRL
jgi:hypothetical protein